MRIAVLGTFLALLATGETRAEEARKPAEIIIGSDKPQAATPAQNCVEVEIGGEPAPPLNCLNRKLRGEVEKVQSPSFAAPFDAKSQDIRVGVVNQSALRQQYGSNFGVSVFPQRPAAPVFVNPTGHH